MSERGEITVTGTTVAISIKTLSAAGGGLS